jgi:hypothetical protein
VRTRYREAVGGLKDIANNFCSNNFLNDDLKTLGDVSFFSNGDALSTYRVQYKILKLSKKKLSAFGGAFPNGLSYLGLHQQRLSPASSGPPPVIGHLDGVGPISTNSHLWQRAFASPQKIKYIKYTHQSRPKKIERHRTKLNGPK